MIKPPTIRAEPFGYQQRYWREFLRPTKGRTAAKVNEAGEPGERAAVAPDRNVDAFAHVAEAREILGLALWQYGPEALCLTGTNIDVTGGVLGPSAVSGLLDPLPTYTSWPSVRRLDAVNNAIRDRTRLALRGSCQGRRIPVPRGSWISSNCSKKRAAKVGWIVAAIEPNCPKPARKTLSISKQVVEKRTVERRWIAYSMLRCSRRQKGGHARSILTSGAVAGLGRPLRGGPSVQISTASAIASASSSSTPRYRTVLSILVCPRRS